MPIRDHKVFWNIVMEDKMFLKVMFENFVIKVNFAIENKSIFESALISGRIFIIILHNLQSIVEKSSKRLELLKNIKKNISLICDHINKSQRLYRKFKHKDEEVMKLTGGLTIIPMHELKV